MQKGRTEKGWAQRAKKRGHNNSPDTHGTSGGFLGKKDLDKFYSIIEELKKYEILNANIIYIEFIENEKPSPTDYQKLKAVYYQIENKSINPNSDLEKILRILVL